MTTYNHSIVLNDSEAIAVEEALRCYRSFCAGELADGPTAPSGPTYSQLKLCSAKYIRTLT